VADVRALIEELYQTTFPMDFAAVLASPVEFHPLATDAATGQSTDLRPLFGTPAELRLALRASAALPLLAGPPVELDGRRFYDAGALVTTASAAPAAVFSIRPTAGSPAVSRLATDGRLLRAAF
jgi:predicted patatin/cPLA2 family phospholipase